MTIEHVLDAVCAYFGVPQAHLAVRKPNLRTIYIRSVATYMVRDATEATYSELAAAIGFMGQPDKPRLAWTKLVQGMKRVVDGEYPTAKRDIAAIRARLTASPRADKPPGRRGSGPAAHAR